MNGKLTDRERISLYYHVVSGGPRLKLLESVIDLKLAEFIGFEGSKTFAEIIEQFALNQHRAQKWLYLLSSEDLLLEIPSENQNQTEYRLGPILKALYQYENGWWFYKEMINSWRSVANQDTIQMLRGAEVSQDVTWPPVHASAQIELESWMAKTSVFAINLLSNYLPITDKSTLLDVGGGDATIACALVDKTPSLCVTVYNLPQAIKLAKTKVEKQGLSDKIKLVEGNFLTDAAFPKGYDIVLFSRVLCDWPIEVCEKLLKMAYDSLNDNGCLVIYEPFKDLNQDLMLVWEYRYMFWDKFGKATFKSIKDYQKVLAKIGFSKSEYSGVLDETVSRIIKAYK